MKRCVSALGMLVLLSAACTANRGPSNQDKLPPGMIILGVDGMDPGFVREHFDELPNLRRLSEQGGFSELRTTVPPQSPVAWSTVTTGMDPGGHGVFDFIHRNTETLLPYSSMAETIEASRIIHVGDFQLPLKAAETHTLRKGDVFWGSLTAAGVPVVISRMPNNFPPVDNGARSLSGMGTPDMAGTFGTFTYYTDDSLEYRDKIPGGRIQRVVVQDHRVATSIQGPENNLRVSEKHAEAPMIVDVDPDEPVVRIEVGDEVLVVSEGEWSDWVRVKFPLVPGLASARGIVRFYLVEAAPTFRLYMSPVNIDPLDPALPISVPEHYAPALAADMGLFYTQGMPEETAALSAHVLTRDAFVEQSKRVLAESVDMLDYELDRFEGGLLFSYFSSVDLSSHMLWGQYEDRELEIYRLVDDVVGRTMERLGPDTVLVVMSDHGFERFERKVHLNAWLMREGYLTLDDPANAGDAPAFVHVNWAKTKAYALGLNGLYINIRGRERDGVVVGSTAPDLEKEITDKLLALTDPETGARVVDTVYQPADTYEGKNLETAPDLIVGYRPPYRQSNDTALGRVPTEWIEDNDDEWIGDHCMAIQYVPGVLISNRPLAIDDPALEDIPVTALKHFGLAVPEAMHGRPVLGGNHAVDQD